MSNTVTLEWQTDVQPPRDYDDYLVTWIIDGRRVVAVSTYDADEGDFECQFVCNEAEAIAWAELPEPYKPEE